MTTEELANALRAIAQNYGATLCLVDIEALNKAAVTLDCMRRPGESEADHINRLLELVRNRK